MIPAILLLAAWLTLASHPDTPIGRALTRWMVEWPVTWIDRIRRGHVVLAFLLVLSVAGLVWLVGEEATRLIGMGAPELASWAVAIDLTTLLDAAVTAVLVGSAVRLRPLLARVRSIRMRRRRTRRQRPVRARRREKRRRWRSQPGRALPRYHDRGAGRPPLKARGGFRRS